MRRDALKPYSKKSIGEMNSQELCRFLQSEGWLPYPEGAPREVGTQWIVTNVFLQFLRDSEDKELAKIEAANFLLRESGSADMMPYIEQALGRKLTPGQLASRHIISVADLF
jgi:hypothetical protein